MASLQIEPWYYNEKGLLLVSANGIKSILPTDYSPCSGSHDIKIEVHHGARPTSEQNKKDEVGTIPYNT